MKSTKKELITAVVIITCLGLVVFWEIMAFLSRRPFKEFDITTADFNDFKIDTKEWEIRKFPVGSDPAEPNILAFTLTRKEDRFVIKVRLVHGYNMRDCMRLKGYTVYLIGGIGSGEETELPETQLWRLISENGEKSIWVTSLLRADDFTRIHRDLRTLPFPRIAVPEDSMWELKGVTWESLKHPVQSFRKFLRAKWNNSRCDILVFLGLKQAPWASHEVLTLVVYAETNEKEEKEIIQIVNKTHDFIYSQLQEFWKGKYRSYQCL